MKYRKYVPQNVAQKNFVPQVPQIVAQFVAQVWHKKGIWGPKSKITLKYLNTRVLRGILVKNSKFEIFRKNLKNRGLGGPKPKITPKYLKTRVLRGFLVKNPKFEIF